MLCEVELRLNRTCEAHAFLANPTVKRLAGLLSGEGVERNAMSLVRLSPGRPHARPLFLAPGLMGLSSEYANLSNALHPDIPVYGIQHADLRKTSETFPGLADVARHYAEQIRKIQPIGPYAVAGYSAAGIVAVAIAQALQEFGEKTDFVGLIDSTPPASVSIPPPFTSLRRTLRFSRTVADRFGEILDEPHALPRLWKRSKSAVVRSLTRWFPLGAPRNQRIDEVIPGMDKQVRNDEKELMQLRLDMIASYELRQDPIDVVLFRTLVDPFEGPHEPDLAWSRALMGHVVVEHLPGPHEKLLSGDGARSLARVMERHLLNRAVVGGVV
jgi:thioesterase domain-containing protein